MSVAEIQDKAFAVINNIDKSLEKSPFIKKLETQTGLPKAYGFIAVVAVYILLIFLNFGGIGQLLANFAALAVPGYYSLVALETKSTADDTHYLTYWVVYATFSVIEFWSNAILYWVPFYWLFKTVFFLYLGLPQFSGARKVYLNVIRPFSVNVLGINSHSSTSSKLVEKTEEAAAAVASGVDK